MRCWVARRDSRLVARRLRFLVKLACFARLRQSKCANSLNHHWAFSNSCSAYRGSNPCLSATGQSPRYLPRLPVVRRPGELPAPAASAHGLRDHTVCPHPRARSGSCKVVQRDVSAAGAVCYGPAADPLNLVCLAADGGAHAESVVGIEKHQSGYGSTNGTRHLEGVVT